ncbi:AraC family transcriptional regulator [Flavobacteriaceae bacterium MAR_2010_72]|nr:AraC family transcriptional regulator [Flavobacteriaceae bacterium MAR_2010_72]TVZ57870.1 AraC family transcriptional regulator [Flavobacteriaceae bacterium MAR_2010_105]
MIFKHDIPKAPLDNFVASIVYYKDFKVEHSKDKLLPDCTTNLVINLFETPRYIYDNETLEEKEACYEAWFSGMHTEYLTISSDNESEMLVISFKSGGVFPFINQSVEAFNNSVVAANTVFGDEILDLRQRLINEIDPDNKIEMAKKWLESRLNEVSFEGEIIQHFVSQIQKSSENINLTELAKKSGYSQKQFIHLFKKYVGLTPKQFHRIVRFNEILNAIFNKERVDWAAFANEFGYYDQAHFIRDFQAFSGHNPKQYIDDQGDWPNYIPVR